MENICKNCKHWEESKFYNLKGIIFGDCNKVEMFWGCTKWDNEGGRILKEEYKDDKAFVQDGSDYTAVLITKEDFGCNQFEK